MIVTSGDMLTVLCHLLEIALMKRKLCLNIFTSHIKKKKKLLEFHIKWVLKKAKAEVGALSQTNKPRFSVTVTPLPVFYCENANTLGLLGVHAPICKVLNYSIP